MVKVLRCHNFSSQQILSVKKEPVCLSFGNNTLFVGTDDSTVEVFKPDRDGHWPQYCCFQTGASLSQIEYNEAGDYVASLEHKVSRLSEVVSVKVYLNWSIAHNNTSYRTRVRVASLGYRSNNVDTGKRLEVVDIPCESPAQFITSCQQTGNIGIVCEKRVKLYHLVEKTIPNSDTTYLDVILFLQLVFPLHITRMCLCEDYVACSSHQYVQVFQLVISNETRSRRTSSKSVQDCFSPTRFGRRTSSVVNSSLSQSLQPQPSHSPQMGDSKLSVKRSDRVSALGRYSLIGDRGSSTPSPAPGLSSNKQIFNSSIDDDADFVVWDFNISMCDKGNSKPDRSGGPGGPDIVEDRSLHIPGLETYGQTQTVPPPPPVLQDHRGGNHNTTGSTSVTQVMYQYLDSGDLSWIHLQLIPTYLTDRQERLGLLESQVPVHSSRHSSMVNMCCFMSGARTGWMYCLTPDVAQLSTYKYTADALQIQTNGHLVYVLVQNGLETYTARSHIAAIHNTQHFDNIHQACPPSTIDICLCGVQTFVGGLRHITLSGRRVGLFNKMVDKDNGHEAWNVYVLEDSSPAELYEDMISFGTKHQKNAADTYHHLLQEGHMILKSNLIGQSLIQSEFSVVESLLQESCGLLGDFYSKAGCEEWQLCLPYYLMSGLSTVDIVQRVLQPQQPKQGKQSGFLYGQGLVKYLQYVLFLDEDPLDIEQTEGDHILSICSQSMPDKYADVLLFSRLQHYTPDKALELLHSVKHTPGDDVRSRTKTRLGQVMLNLQLCDPDTAMESLALVDKNDLIETCVNNHQILHSGLMELSPLSQLLRRACPDVLVHILVSLFDKGDIPMDLAITLLQGNSNVPEVHRNTHVKLYLETLVNDADRRFCFNDAVPALCEMYIHRLAEWQPPTVRHVVNTARKITLPKNTGHFGRRHGWLDSLPPFNGSKSISGPCKYVLPISGRRTGTGAQQWLQCQRSQPGQRSDGSQGLQEVCSCFQCNEDLLKLQSLICSTETSGPMCEKVLGNLEGYKSAVFYQSVYLLCTIHTNIHLVIQTVVHNYPTVVAEFATSIIRQESTLWQYLLTCLLEKVKAYKPTNIVIDDDVNKHNKNMENIKTMEMDKNIKKDKNMTRNEDHDTDDVNTTAIDKHDITNVTDNDSDNSKQLRVYTEAVKDVLREMSDCLKPSVFLCILPADGNAFFYLPYIQRCVDRSKCGTLKYQIQHLGEQMVTMSQ